MCIFNHKLYFLNHVSITIMPYNRISKMMPSKRYVPLLKTLSGTEISFHTFNAFIVYRYKRGLRPRNIGFPLRCVCQCDNVARTRSNLKMLPSKSEISIFYCDQTIYIIKFCMCSKKIFEIFFSSLFPISA